VAYVLLAVAQGIGLLLIPFSSAGIWVQLGTLALFGWWTGFEPVGVIPLVILSVLGLSTGLTTAPLASGDAGDVDRRRLGVAAVVGAGLGAAAGLLLPLLGSMFGSLAGAAVATTLAAFTHRSRAPGFAALGVQAVAMTLRATAGVVIALFTILTVWR